MVEMMGMAGSSSDMSAISKASPNLRVGRVPEEGLRVVEPGPNSPRSAMGCAAPLDGPASAGCRGPGK